jgi:DNA polymerase elongation subunit (family B)
VAECTHRCQWVPDEAALLTALTALVAAWDPDFLVGYETQNGSWGYLVARAAVLRVDLPAVLSRVLPAPTPPHGDAAGVGAAAAAAATRPGGVGAGAGLMPSPGTGAGITGAGAHTGVGAGRGLRTADAWDDTHGAGVRIPGRTVLNLWRIMRGECT